MTVTRNDVARAAGVSPAVVSYVMNEGSRPVATQTRLRVLRAIEELGYRPDPVARSMRTRKSSSLGLVLPDITQTYFARVTQALTNATNAQGLSLSVATSNGHLADERQSLAELARRRVDAAILMSVDPLQDFSWAEAMPMPILLVDRPAVAAATARAAVQHLMQHGCTRIAHVTGMGATVSDHRRREGVRSAILEAGLEADADGMVAAVENSYQGGYHAGVALLARGNRPDAVVIDAPSQAIGFLRACVDQGVSVPDDLLVVAHEVGQVGPFLRPRLSSIDSLIEDVAARAISTLEGVADQRGIVLLSEKADFDFNLRESCGHKDEAEATH